jgi:3,4-dihydroxy 2-butanone 4-phosphate synthase/GTP cyclohydrolase II
MDRLKLPLMVTSTENDESMYTAFTVTVDLRKGTSTGISAADRAATLRAMADPAQFGPDDFRRPGHIFPLRYRQGGVIVRPGHTEAAVDLARASGKKTAGLILQSMLQALGHMGLVQAAVLALLHVDLAHASGVELAGLTVQCKHVAAGRLHVLWGC